ncbi:MAG: chemotaxis protein CheW [Pirellulales bacterium]
MSNVRRSTCSCVAATSGAAVEVDDVEDVQEIAASEVRPLPDAVGRRLAAVADGVVPQDEGMLLMLNVAKLFAVEEPAKK